MPRYFFHTDNDGENEPDLDGTELSSDAAARVEAIVLAGAIMKDDPDVLWDGREFRVKVSNEDSELLFTIVMHAVDEPASL